MAKRRDPSNAEMLFEILEFTFGYIPPWTSIPLALVGGTLIWWAWVSKFRQQPSIHNIGMMLGAVFATICLAAGFAAWQRRRKHERFLKQTIELSAVNEMPWRDFENHVAEVYRQLGYRVQELGGKGPDGGIDLRMERDGVTTVVQCKRWKTWKVGVKPVRELFGVMTAEKADRALFITSGNYTADAMRFAEGKPIELIDGEEFTDLLRCYQKRAQSKSAMPTAAAAKVDAPDSPICPLCQSPMLLRRATRGENAGTEFWGCSTFPKCRGTMALVD